MTVFYLLSLLPPALSRTVSCTKHLTLSLQYFYTENQCQEIVVTFCIVYALDCIVVCSYEIFLRW